MSASTLFLAGCGSSNPGVKGTVKFTDGSPLTKGQVLFTSDRHSAIGEIQPNGSYVMGSLKEGDGLPPGTYKVCIGGEALGNAYDKVPPLVASKFTNDATSGLTCEVKEGSVQDFPITVEPPK